MEDADFNVRFVKVWKKHRQGMEIEREKKREGREEKRREAT